MLQDALKMRFLWFYGRIKLQNEVSLQGPLGYDKEGNEVSLLDILKYESDDITDKIELKAKLKTFTKQWERF